MKRLKITVALTLSAMVAAVIIASFNIVNLYNHEKKELMLRVRECAQNALILEMIGRMESAEKASQSFIRLNSFIETAQQKDGRVAKSDTLQASLLSLLRVGLECKDDSWQSNPNMVDSLFREELRRKGLVSNVAIIRESDSKEQEDAGLWKTTYRYNNNPTSTNDYVLYVSPMYGEVLSNMWGIIIPFTVVIALFLFLSVYLGKTIARMKTLEQMKEDFTHNMTHELKTPVAVAYSAADSMLRYYDQSDEARNRQFLKIIMQRLSFLSGMIENILSMSMERFKTMQLNMECVKLKPVVEEVTTMMELKAGKSVKIDIDIPDNLMVEADSLHLGNVLSNLIDNAIKYSGESVAIYIKADDRSITIADNGIGIDSKNLPYIFDKFYRVTSGNLYEVGGYGLGLFYVKRIVELFGWSIEVVSTPGQGTKFTIKFKSDAER